MLRAMLRAASGEGGPQLVTVSCADSEAGALDTLVRVLVIDEHRLLGDAVSGVLSERGIDVLGNASTADEAYSVVASGLPDVVLACLWVGNLLEREQAYKALALATLAESTSTVEPCPGGFRVYRHGSFSAPPRGSDTVSSESERLNLQTLTRREQQILALLVAGASNKDVARRLSLRPNTVRTHVQHVLHKLGVHSRLEAVALAVGALNSESDAEPVDDAGSRSEPLATIASNGGPGEAGAFTAPADA